MRDAGGRKTGQSESISTASGLEALRSSDAVQTAFTNPDHHESNEHIALIYETQAEQFATAVPFVRQGLERGEKCIYVVDDNSNPELHAAMREGGIDVEAARESGRLAFLTRETYVTNGAFTPEDQLTLLGNEIDAATEEYPRVRVAVEMTCFLDDDLEFEDLIAYEERYNTLSADVDATALCQYNRTRFPTEVIRDTVRAHPHLIADGTLSHNVYYTPPEAFFGADQPANNVDRMTTVMAELAEAETELQRQNDRLEEFASIVSHDLRNPLNVARGQLELAREEHTSEHLDAVARAHDRMDSLIEDLLTLAREGESVDEIEPVDLTKTVNSCWRNVATDEASLLMDPDRAVRADPRRLEQLLENLIRNAVEHGGDDVTVTVGDTDRGFYVEDDGPGIPEDKRKQVFESGYSTSEEGTGFGLKIVERIAEAHDWTIRVADSNAGGARFEITDVEIVER